MGLVDSLRDTDIKRKVLEAFQSKVLSVPEIVNMVQQVEKVVEFVSINRRVENVGRVFDDDVNYAEPNKVFSGVCFNCGINGHVARFCRKKSSKRLKCFRCGSDRHLANKCPVKNANCVDESCADESVYAVTNLGCSKLLSVDMLVGQTNNAKGYGIVLYYYF